MERETRRDVRKVDWFTMRILVDQAQHQDEIDELNRAIRAIQAMPMGDAKKSKKATDDLVRKLKVADDRFYKRN